MKNIIATLTLALSLAGSLAAQDNSQFDLNALHASDVSGMSAPSLADINNVPVGFDDIDTNLAQSQVSNVSANSLQNVSFAKPANFRASWTVIVYINGKNNLALAGANDVHEMEQVGSNAFINIVVEHASLKSEGGPFDGSRRILINKKGAASSRLLQELPNADVGDWRHLVEFAKWAKKSFPAEKYILVVWNHGSGWQSGSKYAKPAGSVDKGISYDDAAKNHITMAEHAAALAAIGPLDVYGSDACLMQDAAVLQELSPYAKVILGSEESEPGDGYDYATFLRRLSRMPGAGPAEAARNVVQSWKEFYGNGDVTQSAVLTDQVPALASAEGTLANAVVDNSDQRAVIGCALSKSVTHFDNYDQLDLGQFSACLAGKSKVLAVQDAARQVVETLRQKLVFANTASGKHSGAMGVSAYLPLADYDTDFDSLKMSKTGWAEMIRSTQKYAQEMTKKSEEPAPDPEAP